MIFIFTYLPFNLWIKFPSTVVLTFQRCIRNPPEDLLKHSCWTLTESFRFSRLRGIWWSAFLTSSLVMLTLLVQGPHVKNRCSRERRIRSHWNCELGSPGRTISLLHLLPSCASHARPAWAFRAKVRGLIQDTARNLEPEQRRALPGEKADPWGRRASHLANKQKGLNLQPDQLFWVNTLQGRLCKHALSTGGLRTSKAGLFFFFSPVSFSSPHTHPPSRFFLSTEKSH